MDLFECQCPWAPQPIHSSINLADLFYAKSGFYWNSDAQSSMKLICCKTHFVDVIPGNRRKLYIKSISFYQQLVTRQFSPKTEKSSATTHTKNSNQIVIDRHRTPHGESNDITRKFCAHLNPSTIHSLLATVPCVHMKLYTVAVRVQQSHESERDSTSNVRLASDRGIRVWRTGERDHRMDRTRRRHDWRLFSIGSAPSNRIATMLNCTNYLFHLIICARMRRRPLRTCANE